MLIELNWLKFIRSVHLNHIEIGLESIALINCFRNYLSKGIECNLKPRCSVRHGVCSRYSNEKYLRLHPTKFTANIK